jgi:UPF0716 protein FxsA
MTGRPVLPPDHGNQTTMPSPFPLLLVAALPLLEIAGFVVVGGALGVLPTLALVIATSIAGSLLLRIQGFGTLSRIRRMLETGGDPGREVAHGVMIMAAGILLIIPGFVTDLLGVLLFLPPVRDLAWRAFSRTATVSRAQRRTRGFDPGAASPGEAARTIDLHEGDYSASPETPWRRTEE